jgi:hypothetical protein
MTDRPPQTGDIREPENAEADEDDVLPRDGE